MTIRKILMAGVAGSVLAAAPLAIVPAMAQTNTTTPQATAPSPSAVQVDRLIGKSVRNPEGDKIGDIEAVYVTPTGQVDTVIVGVGGFLGMGERDVAVKWSDLKVTDNGDKITAAMTKDSLKALPEYTYKDKTYRGKVFSDAGVYNANGSRRADSTTTTTTTTRPSTTTPSTTSPRDTMTRTETPRTDRPAMGGTTATDRAPVRTTTNKNFTKTGEMSADAIIGASVKNSANETIGEIKDIHVGTDGAIKGAVVGVGGFLGVGERDVLMPWSQLQIAREGDDNLVVKTDATKDSLKAMPEYQM
jgi:sporulation protein YlmC with PRC-barrel domain